jgi:hypothetical protein
MLALAAPGVTDAVEPSPPEPHAARPTAAIVASDAVMERSI